MPLGKDTESVSKTGLHKDGCTIFMSSKRNFTDVSLHMIIIFIRQHVTIGSRGIEKTAVGEKLHGISDLARRPYENLTCVLLI